MSVKARESETPAGSESTAWRKRKHHRLHPLVSKSTVESFIKSPPFTCDRTEMDFVLNSVNELETLLTPYSNLPMQIIHHDLLLTNFLIDEEGKISGILDFDFASWDLRIIELANCLQQYIGPKDDLFNIKLIENFLSGMSTTKARFTIDEIHAIPALTKLLYTVRLVLRLGKYLSGFDIIDLLQVTIQQYLFKTRWVENHKQELIYLCKKYVVS
ncbi:phosphotransferase [Paenibacillus mesophilus]|uniref:phosphotransferase n=1 Tax=Paenibacillus mesophilus TaxID=2582849 RepID=UPI003082F6BA